MKTRPCSMQTKSKAEEQIPPELEGLPRCWTDLYLSFDPLVPYTELCRHFGFKNPKSMSGVLNTDPDAPRPYYIGRTAMFDRLEMILWAAERSGAAKRRGCRPAA